MLLFMVYPRIMERICTEEYIFTVKNIFLSAIRHEVKGSFLHISYLSPEPVLDDDEEFLVAKAVVSCAVEKRKDDVHQILGDFVAAGADLGRARELLLVQ